MNPGRPSPLSFIHLKRWVMVFFKRIGNGTGVFWSSLLLRVLLLAFGEMAFPSGIPSVYLYTYLQHVLVYSIFNIDCLFRVFRACLRHKENWFISVWVQVGPCSWSLAWDQDWGRWENVGWHLSVLRSFWSLILDDYVEPLTRFLGRPFAVMALAVQES